MGRLGIRLGIFGSLGISLGIFGILGIFGSLFGSFGIFGCIFGELSSVVSGCGVVVSVVRMRSLYITDDLSSALLSRLG